MKFTARPLVLKNKIQHYEWGARGEGAFIPSLTGIPAEPDIPCAELWMGAHPKAPSEVETEDGIIGLNQLISLFPVETLGPDVSKTYNGKLPFLLKVLSVEESLSIQVHPDKKQAEMLYKRDPENYPDDNHKPEIAIALGSFRGLVDFKNLENMRKTLEEYPEIAEFTGEEISGRIKNCSPSSGEAQGELLRELYTAYIRRSVEDREGLVRAADSLRNRLSREGALLKEEDRLFCSMYEKYSGGDVGLFAIYLLNLIHLRKGEGVFLEAGIPHAYLKGNIIECMANSDNVIRAGLTAKYQDLETITGIMNYNAAPVQVLGGDNDDEKLMYPSPAPEFQIVRLKLNKNRKREEETGNKPEILLVTEGDISIQCGSGSNIFKEKLYRGKSVFIPASVTRYTITAESFAVVFIAQVP